MNTTDNLLPDNPHVVQFLQKNYKKTLLSSR